MNAGILAQEDAKRVLNSDLQRPFTGTEDILDRLLPYHVSAQCTSPKQASPTRLACSSLMDVQVFQHDSSSHRAGRSNSKDQHEPDWASTAMQQTAWLLVTIADLEVQR